MGNDDVRSAILAFLLLISGALTGLSWSGKAEAAEGASSNYFPGSYGDFLVAMAPDPGWIYQNYSMFYGAEVNQAVLQGRVNASIDTFSYANMSALLNTFEKPVLGATFSMGGYLTLAYVDLDSSLVGQNTSATVNDSVTGIGDISLMPASFYWNSGDWHFNLYETIIAPTGKYDVDDAVNIGMNYWSFDTVFALTYFYPESGFEILRATPMVLARRCFGCPRPGAAT